MAKITLGGHPAETIGELPEVGSKAPDFKLTATDMSTKSMGDFSGNKLVLNIFPSVNTASAPLQHENSMRKLLTLQTQEVLCISKDLPFAQQQFCAAEGLKTW